MLYSVTSGPPECFVAWLAKQICLVFVPLILPVGALGQFSRNTVTVSGVVLSEEGRRGRNGHPPWSAVKSEFLAGIL
jgi:hypothetical protein